MNYIKNNKLAWEDAFKNRRQGWGENHWERLSNETLPFFNEDMVTELRGIGLEGKRIAQFCCNNGRELLSAMQLRPSFGVGFDIAEDFIEQARQIAAKLGQTNCEFVACNILDIDELYHNSFDFIFFTVGAITWFEDLDLLFEKVGKCLRPHGKLIINDSHPFINMLPLPGEDAYDPEHLSQVAYSYFRKEPWIETNGMSYITPEYHSKTFTSFSHTMSSIVNAIVGAGITIKKLNEYDYDIGLTDDYEGKGFPLSFILLCEKSK
ncbi:MAG: methyltransferase domain-containing protein [Clostridia bacterium]|nr:methyltransferase domain-containing protein [Clostridia bacterium]